MDLYLRLAQAHGQEPFDVLYPSGRTMGDDVSKRATINLMKELSGSDVEVTTLPTSGYTGEFHWKGYVLRWNYPQKWIELYKQANVRMSGMNKVNEQPVATSV